MCPKIKNKRKKAVFLDRDGIINQVVYHKEVNKPSSPWKIEEFKLISGINKYLEELKKLGFLLFVISNQPDINRGNIKRGTTEEINKIIYEKYPIDGIMVCPHDDKDNCSCRKPKPGMILDLSKKWDVDLKKSYLIGDSWKDIKAGKNAGVKSILLDTKYNQGTDSEYKVKDLKSAIELIKSQI
jgi:D-glycero-D-manno-heptose 1,7-bisphosphate phosphatase